MKIHEKNIRKELDLNTIPITIMFHNENKKCKIATNLIVEQFWASELQVNPFVVF